MVGVAVLVPGSGMCAPENMRTASDFVGERIGNSELKRQSASRTMARSALNKTAAVPTQQRHP